MDTGAICWTLPNPNPTQPNIFRTNKTRPNPSKQCNIVGQFYINNVHITRRYPMLINSVTHRTDNIVKSAANTTQSVIKLCCYNRGVHKMCRLSTAFNKHLLGKNTICNLDPTLPLDDWNLWPNRTQMVWLDPCLPLGQRWICKVSPCLSLSTTPNSCY